VTNCSNAWRQRRRLGVGARRCDRGSVGPEPGMHQGREASLQAQLTSHQFLLRNQPTFGKGQFS
jgi:hypothetical protein